MVVWPGVGWSVADVARGWAVGLEQMGVHVTRFRLDHRIDWLSTATKAVEGPFSDEDAPAANRDVRLRAAESLTGAVWACDPDFVVICSGWDIPPATYALFQERGIRVVLVHTESPYEDVRQTAMHWCADLHLMNDPVGVEHMRSRGVRVEYARHCYDPSIHYPGAGPRDLNTVFVGSGFAGRSELLQQVDWDSVGGLTLAGQWDEDGPLGRWCPRDLPAPLPNEETADLYRRCRVGLNLYRVDHVEHADLRDGWAMGPREVEMAACGLFFLRQSRPESDRVFPMLPTFSDAGELHDLVSWWLAHDEAREDATKAMLASVADRTFAANARGLLGLVEEVWGQVDRRQPLTV